MSEKDFKWLMIVGVAAICAICVASAISKVRSSEAMGLYEYQAYSDYLQTCEIMDVVPLPPAIREEGE